MGLVWRRRYRPPALPHSPFHYSKPRKQLLNFVSYVGLKQLAV